MFDTEDALIRIDMSEYMEKHTVRFLSCVDCWSLIFLIAMLFHDPTLTPTFFTQ